MGEQPSASGVDTAISVAAAVTPRRRPTEANDEPSPFKVQASDIAYDAFSDDDDWSGERYLHPSEQDLIPGVDSGL